MEFPTNDLDGHIDDLNDHKNVLSLHIGNLCGHMHDLECHNSLS
ncbi:MAG: hypothetical protein AABP62_21755 [Planctomycetota bacterium]